MTPVGSLLDQLGRLAGRALALGEASDVVLRLHARVDAAQKGPLELELRRRVKEGLEAAGIRIPYPHRVVHVAADHLPFEAQNRKESLA